MVYMAKKIDTAIHGLDGLTHLLLLRIHALRPMMISGQYMVGPQKNEWPVSPHMVESDWVTIRVIPSTYG